MSTLSCKSWLVGAQAELRCFDEAPDGSQIEMGAGYGARARFGGCAEITGKFSHR